MNSKLKSVFGFLVLASFMVMLTPKNWLHDCQSKHFDSEKTSEHKGLNIHQSTDDCAFCDLQIPVLGISVLQIVFEFQEKNENKPFIEKDYCISQESLASSGRGPPSV